MDNDSKIAIIILIFFILSPPLLLRYESPDGKSKLKTAYLGKLGAKFVNVGKRLIIAYVILLYES